MSVTIYLTDHNGRKISFFYRIDNERYLTCPQLVWSCREYPKYQGTAESKEDFIEQCKGVIKMINRNLPKQCEECGLTEPKLESQDTCPDCLGDPYSYK
jgi:hypothetical protein